MNPHDIPGVAGVEHRWLAVRGTTIHVATAGDADGRPVLLLHGWPQHWYAFRHLLADPPAGLRLIAVDLPGYGWSAPAPHRFEKEEVADDLLALADALGLERFLLVGHDWGGWVGFLMALRAPERVERYLALNIAHPWGSVRQAPHLWRLLLYQPIVLVGGASLHRFTPFVRIVLRAGLDRRDAASAEEIEAFAARFRVPSVARTAARTYRTFVLRELPRIARRPERRRLTVPTRMLFGTGDLAISRALTDPRRALADDYAVHYIEDCGHFIADERPDVVRRAVDGWLRDGVSASV